MRLVLDTNVLLAAFLTRGLCHDLLEHCEREHTLVLSEYILAEVEEKLRGKFRAPDELVKRTLSLLRGHAELVEPGPLPQPVCEDPDDDAVLATAVSGDCRCVVTGDKAFLRVGEHQRVRVLAPRDFWAFESEAGDA